MNTLNLYKADSISQKEILGSIIHIKDKLPEFETLTELEKCYDLQANELAYVLRITLPQAVYDRLIIAIMSDTVSLYRGSKK
jgi:hypothetical protein